MTANCWRGSLPPLADSLQQHGCGFVVGILRDELAGERFFEHRTAEANGMSDLFFNDTFASLDFRQPALKFLHDSQLFWGRWKW